MTIVDTLLSISEIEPDPTQPRQQFDELKEAELTASIRQHGLLEPILVCHDPDRRAYRIISGERRYRCCRQAGLEQIPVRVMNGELPASEKLLIQLAENLDRDDLKPAETGRALAQLQAELGCTQDQLAQKVNRSPATISRFLKLLQLPLELQEQVDLGQLPLAIAVELARCPTEQLQREIAHAVTSGELNRASAVERIQQVSRKKASAGKRRNSVAIAESGISASVAVSAEANLDQWIALLQRLLKVCQKVKRRDGDIEMLHAVLQAESANEFAKQGDRT